MPRLTEEEKHERKRQRMLKKFAEYTLGKAKNVVAKDFQKMIRAEAAAKPQQYEVAVVDGEFRFVFRKVGQCVCITCGAVMPWKSNSLDLGGKLDCGHFVPSRNPSVIFEENNAHPQCVHCNRDLGGNQAAYLKWMVARYGESEVNRLSGLKNKQWKFTKEQLVDLRFEFRERVKNAILRMEMEC